MPDWYQGYCELGSSGSQCTQNQHTLAGIFLLWQEEGEISEKWGPPEEAFYGHEKDMQVSITMGLQTNLPKQPISSVSFSHIFLLVTFPQFTTQAQISFSFVLSHLHVHHSAKKICKFPGLSASSGLAFLRRPPCAHIIVNLSFLSL